ncbi:Protein CBG23809 [Caenorhabditis briggsae]|uniref:Protein CBG23809 n=1 Tax=Caenorhabditis briggsae TaxID=6238 RepID=A8WJC3_CAEBR|nr:Protein CBG23809 [Caenorhabditis briggsae]CAP20566.2 Protein CBG23809 [Caenorhabditis briggsae]
MSSLSSSSSNVRMDRRFDWVGPPDSVSKIRKIIEWYRRNLQLIWPALKVNVVRFFRMARR